MHFFLIRYSYISIIFATIMSFINNFWIPHIVTILMVYNESVDGRGGSRGGRSRSSYSSYRSYRGPGYYSYRGSYGSSGSSGDTLTWVIVFISVFGGLGILWVLYHCIRRRKTPNAAASIKVDEKIPLQGQAIPAVDDSIYPPEFAGMTIGGGGGSYDHPVVQPSAASHAPELPLQEPPPPPSGTFSGYNIYPSNVENPSLYSYPEQPAMPDYSIYPPGTAPSGPAPYQQDAPTSGKEVTLGEYSIYPNANAASGGSENLPPPPNYYSAI